MEAAYCACRQTKQPCRHAVPTVNTPTSSRQQAEGLTKPRVSGQAAQRVTCHHPAHAVGHQHESEGPLLSLLGPSRPAAMQLLQVPDAAQHKVCLAVLH